jgi:raffinose/stachyose/melibiose transport system permease protein
MHRSKLVFWGFLAPCLITFSLAVIIPMFMGFYYSFTDWNGIKSNANFVGIENYIQIFTSDTRFSHAFLFTMLFAFGAVLLVNFVALCLSLLVTQPFRWCNLFRSFYFMPNLIGGILVGFIWQFVFTSVFNMIGSDLNISWLQNWLSDQTTGTVAILIVTVWQMAGYMMLIYIAQIQNIPGDLIEAARIDGASRWQCLWKIKLPLMMPAFTIGLFLTLASCFKTYDLNLSLTNGGPYYSTEMLSMNIYNTAFVYNKLGLAQAKGVVFLVIIAAITLSQLITFKKKEVEM